MRLAIHTRTYDVHVSIEVINLVVRRLTEQLPLEVSWVEVSVVVPRLDGNLRKKGNQRKQMQPSRHSLTSNGFARHQVYFRAS